MQRPVGVTASAIVAILGGVLAVAFAAIALASPSIAPPTPQQAATDPRMLYWGVAMFAAFGIAMIVTAVGLFQLRPWARISILVFATFIAFSGLMALLAILTVPMPTDVSAEIRHFMRIVIAIAFSIPLIVGIWWLVQFNRPATKAAFQSHEIGRTSLVPASISVIAWTTIIGGVLCVVPLIARAPIVLFGAIFTGWIAGIYYAVCVALSIYIGKGLLALEERARLVAIGWYAVSLAHWGIVMLVPTFRNRMFEAQKTIAGSQPAPVTFDQTGMTFVMLSAVAIVVATAIWFLVRNRAAFVKAEAVPA